MADLPTSGDKISTLPVLPSLPGGTILPVVIPDGAGGYSNASALASTISTLAVTAASITDALGGIAPYLSTNPAGYVTAGQAAAGAPVQSVAGRSGVITLTKSDVALGNVDNTSDANKPISTATQGALNSKAPLASPAFTGTVTGVTKSMVGLANVDNTADTAKPVSTAQQTALDLKAPLASPSFTGVPQSATYMLNGVQLGAAGGSSVLGFQNAGTGALVRSVQSRFRDTIQLADWLIGNGTTDDTAKFQALAAYCDTLTTGVTLEWGNLTPKITGDVTFNKSVAFRGGGPGVSQLLLYNNARLVLLGNRTPYTMPSFTIEGIWLKTDGIHTTGPLRVDYSTNRAGGSLGDTLVMRDVVISGRNATSGFNRAIELYNVPWPRIDNVVVFGDTGNSPPQSKFGLLYTGSDGAGTFNQLRCYYVEEAVHLEGDDAFEGHVFDRCEFVVCRRGLYARDQTGGSQPFYVLRNSHINAEQCNVRMIGIDSFMIEGCSFFGQNFDNTEAVWTAIDITPTEGGSAIIVSGIAANNFIYGDGAFAATKIGIRVRGSAAYEDYLFSGRIQGCTTGVQLDSGTNRVRLSRDLIINNTGTPVVNNGQNIIQCAGYSYPVAQLPAVGSFLENLEGLRLFVFDGGGSGIAFGGGVVGGGTSKVPVYYENGSGWHYG